MRIAARSLALAALALPLAGCATMLPLQGALSPKEAIELAQATGVSGCSYLHVTGTYPGFSVAEALIVQVHDARPPEAQGKGVTFLDCLKAIPPAARQMLRQP